LFIFKGTTIIIFGSVLIIANTIAKMYFIYGGERHLREGDIAILPIRDALKELSEILSH